MAREVVSVVKLNLDYVVLLEVDWSMSLVVSFLGCVGCKIENQLCILLVEVW
jgi:hypothetical protein